MFELKTYQQEALDKLREYLALTRAMGAKNAFISLTERPYHSVKQLPALPYICLRIPTGGGKTLMACHAVGIASQEVLRQERCLVLWLVPTNTIKEQTLTALRDLQHPYRQALDATLDRRVRVLDLLEAQYLQRATLDAETTIIVSTVAALRIEDTEGRKIYDQNGSLMSHFDGLTEQQTVRLEKYEGSDKAIPSLANVLRLRHPVVIVDEAHNVRTELSFDTLARFGPSCILELTATPHTGEQPSNVLYHCTGYQLKQEQMIKLPIRLETHADWKEALLAAIKQQATLEALTKKERPKTGDYIRPIVLVQAEKRAKHGDPLVVEVVKEGLKDLGVKEEWIAIETGTIGEVKKWEDDHKLTLFDEKCPIRFIITVDKLREGWDCPFAYALCSVRDIASPTAIEQILGRVLRMPKAKKREHDELNRAYAYVTSERTADTARTIEGVTGALEANGLTKFEAQQFVEHQGGFEMEGGLFTPVAKAKPSPADRGEKFVVPQLALWSDGELEAVEQDHFMQFAWKLADCDASLSEQEFPTHAQTAEALEVDVRQDGKASVQRVADPFIADLQKELALLLPNDLKTPAELAVWLDSHIHHPDIVSTQSRLFLLRMVERLVSGRRFTLDQLSRERLRLKDSAEAKIDQYRQKATWSSYNQLLFGQPAAELEVSPKCVFAYDPQNYPAAEFYEGNYRFEHHFYRAIGVMNDEEERVARLLDTLPKVKYWVRNLERRPQWSFSLPTPTDRFYPDFVAVLKDGRILVVEYKGAHLLTTDDTKEKRKIGELWQAQSKGKCHFELVSDEDFEAKLRAVAG